MDLKKLLFGKVENVNEFIEKSNSKILKYAFWINIALLLFVFKFLGGDAGLHIWASTGDFGEFFELLGMEIQSRGGICIVGMIFTIIFTASLVFICVLRGKHTKELDEKFWEYKATIESDKNLMAQYDACYRKRAKDYVLVNGFFYAKDKNSSVKNGYKSNTVACLILTIFICIGATVLVFSWLLWRLFNIQWVSEFFMQRGASWLFLLCVAAPVFYVWYTKKRFTTHKYYVANVTTESLFDESYVANFDKGFTNYIDADEKLSNLADKYPKRYSKGRLFALCVTWEDRLIFGGFIAAMFIYVWLIIMLYALIAKVIFGGSSSSSSSGRSYSSSDSHSSSSSSDNCSQDEPAPAKRLVLVGRGWNEYYEIDGTDIREGLGTPYGRIVDDYEVHGNEIWYQKDGQWKTMARISTDGSDGSVMYSNDYDGEKIFERYEWKA